MDGHMGGDEGCSLGVLLSMASLGSSSSATKCCCSDEGGAGLSPRRWFCGVGRKDYRCGALMIVLSFMLFLCFEQTTSSPGLREERGNEENWDKKGKARGNMGKIGTKEKWVTFFRGRIKKGEREEEKEIEERLDPTMGSSEKEETQRPMTRGKRMNCRGLRKRGCGRLRKKKKYEIVTMTELLVRLLKDGEGENEDDVTFESSERNFIQKMASSRNFKKNDAAWMQSGAPECSLQQLMRETGKRRVFVLCVFEEDVEYERNDCFDDMIDVKKIENKGKLVSPGDDEDSREVFGLIKKLNTVPEARKKAKTTSFFDTMLTGGNSNSSSKSSFLSRASSHSLPPSSKQKGSSGVRSFIFGRDDSNSRSSISISEDTSDTIQSSMQSSVRKEDHKVELSQSVFAAFKIPKKPVRIPGRV
ncbi:hypothetical protein Tco_1043577 [Tanacetum coccineum]|uniref:Uncharacterized protein n=1 Tax=Tanacetum coccineum TaxID=301880 RepID=A0ABQ5GPL9_9ASTR